MTSATPTPGDFEPFVLGLSVHQPACLLLATGWCRCHERSWSTGYRGIVALHASEALDAADAAIWSAVAVRNGFRSRTGIRHLEDAPRGCVVGVALLTDAVPVTGTHRKPVLHPNDALAGPLAAGNTLLVLSSPRVLPSPVYCDAGPGLFRLPGHAEGRVLDQVRELGGVYGQVGKTATR